MCQSAHAVDEILKDRSKSSGFPVDCHILIQWQEMLIIFYIFFFSVEVNAVDFWIGTA